MKNKLIIGIAIGSVLSLVLVLAVVGLISLVRVQPRAQLVSKSPSGASSAKINPSQAMAPAASRDQQQVLINGRALTAQQLQDFQALYRVQPRPGNYWYDNRSGLYGVVGSAAAGFMYPGHDLGPLATDASAGNTEVYINGRNLTVQEVQILSGLARMQVQPGRYWLDGQGNAGYEGNPFPVGNLFAAALAQQQGGGGGARGGDNFWNSRFSAGNYNSDNSQGYVSVPGVGPVGYGF